MWNTIYGSTSYEKYHSFKTHVGHIERLASAKPVIDTRTPHNPSFLWNQRIKYCIKREQHVKSDYDNKNLYGRMEDIGHKYSRYSKYNNMPLYTFSAKSKFKNRTIQKNIAKENMKMHGRLHSAKPAYSNNNYKAHYEKNCYLNQQISNFAPNPRINYATLSQFNKHLTIQIRRERMPPPVHCPKRLFTSNGIRSNYTPEFSEFNERYAHTCYN